MTGTALLVYAIASTSIHADTIPSIPYDQKESHPDKPAALPLPAGAEGLRVVPLDEIAQHTTREKGVWVVIEGTVWE
jgi:hypothetical protein